MGVFFLGGGWHPLETMQIAWGRNKILCVQDGGINKQFPPKCLPLFTEVTTEPHNTIASIEQEINKKHVRLEIREVLF